MFVVLLVSNSDNLIKGLDLQDKDLGRRVGRGVGRSGEEGGEGWGGVGHVQVTVEDDSFANTKR